jgi:hypothetical protein
MYRRLMFIIIIIYVFIILFFLLLFDILYYYHHHIYVIIIIYVIITSFAFLLLCHIGAGNCAMYRQAHEQCGGVAGGCRKSPVCCRVEG